MAASDKKPTISQILANGGKQSQPEFTQPDDRAVAVEDGPDGSTATAGRRRPKRPVRVPIGTRHVLTAPQRAGFVRRFVNDSEERVKKFLEAGYTIVMDSDIQVGDPGAGRDTPVGSPVTKAVGGGVKAVLMEIPVEWHEEDQKLKHTTIDDLEKQMCQNVMHNSSLDYAGELKISRS